ncbi:ATP-binding protein [Kitasatospora azatica]|uniref:ATP-binding protein n=1 Tax=Kitasatospora azatica TaxID=58347 RepID=UPI00056111ED|nr:ATP-binding protein [Kitasatospora azatica]
MAHKLLDITPTPQVLVALTRTPISPLDALSELIDNAIDSFRAAATAGKPSPVRQVIIEIPSAAEVSRGEGLVRVRDTGPGLSEEQIADSMRAGFSSKNHFDTLGLFGMGFNIATGKLGRITRVVSARAQDPHAIQVTLDLPKLIQEQSFAAEAEQVPKPPGLTHGTVVEIRGWWPDGDGNSGFIRNLAKLPRKTLRDRLGRRYASLLRTDSSTPVIISVNGERCQPFEHCVWSKERFVERQSHGKVPARIDFDEQISRARRCLHDGTDFGVSATCPRCGGTESRQVVHRVRGWVGIQRFDDQNDFGIDLIRNGRVIRVAEKAAFFEFADESTGRSEREYPIDQQYGRIVGEVHLDQVPVDFQKQNFQQATDEWQDAMRYLRGGSLLPTKWSDEERNESPVSRLFQGYRKVRNFGRSDMYMGQYNPAKGKADRISRDTERAYHQKFLDREPGYYTDEKWWELVETAGEPPIQELPECGDCGFQNTPAAEECGGCGQVLNGKTCLSADCRKQIPRSSTACPHCATSQVPTVQLPWKCAFCSSENKAGDESCNVCGSIKGAPHPASPEALALASTKEPDYCASQLMVALADGKMSSPLDIAAHTVHRPIIPAYGREPVPLVTGAAMGRITVYVDPTHPVFTAMGLRPEYLVATEAAQYLYSLHRNLQNQPGHTVAAMTAELLKQGWGDAVTDNADTVRGDIKELFSQITEKILLAPHAEDFYSELDETQQLALAESMIKSGADLAELGRLKSTGGYLRYCDRDTVTAFFARHSDSWFNGLVWQDPWPSEAEVGPLIAGKLREVLRLKYLRCLEDCASYMRYEQPERLIIVRARAAVDFLADKLS